MKVYEYKCRKCNSLLEKAELLPTHKVVCECGGETKRVFSLGGFQIK